MPAPSGADRIRSHIIPSPAVAAFVGMLDRVQGPARITASDVAISVDAEGIFAASRLIAGEFPSYKSHVAGIVGGKGLRIAASELSDAVSRIISLRAETKAPCVTFTPNGSSIELASDKRGRNEGREVVDADIIEETPAFTVSTSYLASLLSLWPENAVLDVAQPVAGKHLGNPITIMSPSVPGLFQLIMPMNP
jgi:DNA polymerase III sliding clamp (beta) subunit (PCNA family)